jgi:hypothetical protein
LACGESVEFLKFCRNPIAFVQLRGAQALIEGALERDRIFCSGSLRRRLKTPVRSLGASSGASMFV